jgi:GT2 family glycosyltransferase
MPAQSPVPVAVIIPVYNGKKYLGETIESVLRQTVPPAEIFVIDDGSSDGSAELARSFGPAITVVERANAGVCATRNFGASLAKSKWLAFLDQDDLWEPENLERQAAAIAQHPEAEFCYADRRILYVSVADDGSESRTAIAETKAPPAAEMQGVLLDRCPFTPCSALIRRDPFLAVGGFDTKHSGAEDWDLWLRLSAHGVHFLYVPEPLIQYRVHTGAVSQNALKMLPVLLGVVDQNILPRMSPLERLTTGRRLRSRLEAEAAVLMRETKTPGSLAMMMRSIARAPFHSLRRYKIAAHMMLH